MALPEDDFTKSALAALNPSQTTAPVPPVYDQSVPLVPQAAQMFAPPASIALPAPTAPVDPNLAAAQAIQAKANASRASAPAAPTVSAPAASYTGDLLANRDNTLGALNTKRDAQLGPLDTQISTLKSGIENGTIAPTAETSKQLAALEKQRGNLGAAYDIATAKVNQQYPINPDGTVDFTKIRPGQFNAKQLGTFGANNTLNLANQNTKLAQDQVKAQEAETNAVAQRDDNLAKAATATGQMIDNHIQLTQQHQKEYQAGLQNVNDSYDKAVNDFKGAHVDPSRYWRDTGIGAALGIAVFAGLEQAFKARGGVHTPNSIVQSVNNLVAQDIDAQKSEIDKKGKAVDFANTAVGHFRQQGMDQQQADAAALSLGLTKAAQQVDATMAQSGSAIDLAKGQQVRDQLLMQANTARNAAMAPAIAGLSHLLAPTGTAGGTAIKYDAKSGNYYKVDANNKIVGYASPADAKTYEQTNKLRNGGTGNARNERFIAQSTVVLPDGSKVVYDNPKQAGTAQQTVKFGTDTLELTDELQKLGPKYSNPITVADKNHNNRVDAIITRLAPIVGKLGNPDQQVSAPEQEAIQHSLNPGNSNIVSRGLGIDEADNKEAIKSIREQAQAAIKRAATYGADKATAKGPGGTDDLPEKESENE